MFEWLKDKFKKKDENEKTEELIEENLDENIEEEKEEIEEIHEKLEEVSEEGNLSKEEVKTSEEKEYTNEVFKDKEVKDSDKFSLVMNNYRATGAGGFHMYKDLKVLKNYDKEVAEILLDYFRNL